MDESISYSKQFKAASDCKNFLFRKSDHFRTELLFAVGLEIKTSYDEILNANKLDFAAGESRGLRPDLMDRLKLPNANGASEIFEETAKVPDLFEKPQHETTSVFRNMRILNRTDLFSYERTWRVPLGVVGQIFESRPSSTMIGIAMALKTANCIVLKGGKEALHSNRKILEIAQRALTKKNAPKDMIQLLEDDSTYAGSRALLEAEGLVDAVVIRGGAKTIGDLKKYAKVPLIITGEGVVHAYVEESAHIKRTVDAIVFAKLKGTTWCSCTDTVLVDRANAKAFLSEFDQRCRLEKIELVGCPRTAEIINCKINDLGWDTEHLSKKVAIRIVDNAEEAFAHIRKYSTGHTECIYSENEETISKFERGIESSALFVNAPSIYHGSMFGNGYPYHFGICTTKLPRWGKMDLTALTSTKNIARRAFSINQDEN